MLTVTNKMQLYNVFNVQREQIEYISDFSDSAMTLGSLVKTQKQYFELFVVENGVVERAFKLATDLSYLKKNVVVHLFGNIDFPKLPLISQIRICQYVPAHKAYSMPLLRSLTVKDRLIFTVDSKEMLKTILDDILNGSTFGFTKPRPRIVFKCEMGLDVEVLNKLKEMDFGQMAFKWEVTTELEMEVKNELPIEEEKKTKKKKGKAEDVVTDEVAEVSVINEPAAGEEVPF